MQAERIISAVFDLGPEVRYVAVAHGQDVTMQQRPNLSLASASQSDRFEELLVNPTLLTLATQRGEKRKETLVAFGELLNQHIRSEERRLFQEIQSTVGEFRLAQLGREIEEHVHKLCPSTQFLPWENR